jgi:hypothetical protein
MQSIRQGYSRSNDIDDGEPAEFRAAVEQGQMLRAATESHNF